MSEAVYEKIKKNLDILNMKNTSLILDNYLEKAIHDKTNIVEILDYLLAEEAKTKKTGLLKTRSKCQVFLTEKLWSSLTLTFSQASIKNRLWSLPQCALLKIKRM